MRSGRQADAHLLVPDLRLLAEFAADTLVHHQIQSLDGYATVLNKEAAALAETLEDSHPLRAQLVANDGKPWSQPNCRRILDIYLRGFCRAGAQRGNFGRGSAGNLGILIDLLGSKDLKPVAGGQALCMTTMDNKWLNPS